MKKLLSLSFLSLFTIGAQACPDLAGQYINCTSGDEQTDIFMEIEPSLNMSQMIVNGAMTYSADDGVEVDTIVVGRLESETEVEDGITYTTETLASCNSDMLILNQKVTISGDGSSLNLGFKISTSANSAGLEMTTEILADGEDSEFITVTCDRK